jgi:hypothetical protein
VRTQEPTARRWRASLVGGVVVLGAVWALLEALRRAVLDLETAVDRVWTSGKRLAQNTQAAHLLVTTRTRTAQVREELAAAGGEKETA